MELNGFTTDFKTRDEAMREKYAEDLERDPVRKYLV